MRNIESFSLENTPETKKRKKQSGVSRVASGSEKKEQESLEHFERKFLKYEFFKEEREKTEQEIELINSINENMKEFVKEWGGDWLEIKPEKIHFIDESKLTQEQKDYLEKQEYGGYYSPNEQVIIVFPYKQKRRLILAQHLTHEMLHFNAFTSFTKEKELKPRKVGVRMFSERYKKIFFYDWDEALIVELEKKFDHKYFQDMPYLSEDIEKRNEHLERLADDLQEEERDEVAFIGTELVDDSNVDHDVYEIEIEEYTNHAQRKDLGELISEIYEKNKKDFSSEKEVFDIFVRSLFSGKSLKLARLIEKTFGKGSFREKGEETARAMEVDEKLIKE